MTAELRKTLDPADKIRLYLLWRSCKQLTAVKVMASMKTKLTVVRMDDLLTQICINNVPKQIHRTVPALQSEYPWVFIISAETIGQDQKPRPIKRFGCSN